jgi:hypothetical protein
MRALAEAFPNREIVQQVIAQLPWGHAITLVEAVISSDLFARQGKAITNLNAPCPPRNRIWRRR